ncbi:hypothetical protein KAM347_18610 [Aeromonas caviae]|nr:hypothetical protein KAM341_38140 [Aeromonas caviae]GJA38608.1 hypothetical protein KAM342_38510 [Aeromonas caviae]GJA50070.1 hypothetical protein KAM347_18610 [Aeromonas caviae]GJA58737.1 hypothetical protein KAM350_17300 [Aeromonas caviae]GJA68037.1 hypothetical protein KAM352_20130 [Aeromonas caviae]
MNQLQLIDKILMHTLGQCPTISLTPILSSKERVLQGYIIERKNILLQKKQAAACIDSFHLHKTLLSEDL